MNTVMVILLNKSELLIFYITSFFFQFICMHRDRDRYFRKLAKSVLRREGQFRFFSREGGYRKAHGIKNGGLSAAERESHKFWDRNSSSCYIIRHILVSIINWIIIFYNDFSISPRLRRFYAAKMKSSEGLLKNWVFRNVVWSFILTFVIKIISLWFIILLK